VQEQFAEKFPETPVTHRNAVRRIIEKFRKTGSVLDAERTGRQSEPNDKKLMDISDSMLRAAYQNHCASWCSWTSLPTPFIISQQLSESTVYKKNWPLCRACVF
jgi:hypothetical protein